MNAPKCPKRPPGSFLLIYANARLFSYQGIDSKSLKGYHVCGCVHVCVYVCMFAPHYKKAQVSRRTS